MLYPKSLLLVSLTLLGASVHARPAITATTDLSADDVVAAHPLVLVPSVDAPVVIPGAADNTTLLAAIPNIQATVDRNPTLADAAATSNSTKRAVSLGRRATCVANNGKGIDQALWAGYAGAFCDAFFLGTASIVNGKCTPTAFVPADATLGIPFEMHFQGCAKGATSLFSFSVPVTNALCKAQFARIVAYGRKFPCFGGIPVTKDLESGGDNRNGQPFADPLQDYAFQGMDWKFWAV